VAADKDQARLLVDSVAGFVARTPLLRGALEVAAFRVVAPRTGAVLEILAADAESAWGIRPWLLVADELAQWGTTSGPRRLWEAVSSASAKVAGARLVEARRISPRRRPLDLVDAPQAIRLRVLEHPCAPVGRVTGGGQHVCHAEPLTRTLEDGTLTAGARVVVDRLQVWAGSRARPVQLAEVGEWLRYVAAEYHGASVVFDPHQAIDLTQRLARLGVRTAKYDFTASSVGRLALALYQALRNRTLSIPNDPELIDELLNVRLRETSPGIYRIDHDADKHDDRVIALALCVEHLQASPPTRPPWRDGEGLARGHIGDARGSGAPARGRARLAARDAQRERDLEFAVELGILVNLDGYGGLR
jgi:hypothetical protein